jgi:hypothetical protein
MNFSIGQSLEILQQTPSTLEALVGNISPGWTSANEGDETWSVFDVIGHLVHGEKTDWMVRAEIILSQRPDKTFSKFDRFAQFHESKGKTLSQLLQEFRELRSKNIEWLLSQDISDSQLKETGIHRVLGEVTLSQLLATWTVHDLNHIWQITRVMAHQYRSEVGPWSQFLGILKPR